MKGNKIGNKVYFKSFEKQDINDVSNLITNSFLRYDPFFMFLKPDQFQFTIYLKENLEKFVEEGLSIIVKDKETNQVIGSYFGMTLKKMESNLNKQRLFTDLKGNNIIIKENIIESSFDDKITLFNEIDSVLLNNSYQYHLSNNELDKAIFCDYYCIEDSFFGTDLSKILAFKFFLHCVSKGTKFIYGSFYNSKATSIMLKNFPAKICERFKIYLNKTGDNVDIKDNLLVFEVLLLLGNSDDFKEYFSKPKSKF